MRFGARRGSSRSFRQSGLKVRWRVPIGGGYAGPAVARGRVYVMDRQLAKGTTNPANPFARGEIPGSERVLCLNEADGKILWQHEYDCAYTVSYASGPRATPTVADGKVYTLGAEGNLVCLDAEKGKVLWSHDFKKIFGIKTPMWGFAGHPLVDGKKLICLAGGDGSVAVAFDKDTGKELWRALSAKEPGYAPPMIYEFAGKRQLILWHPEAVNSLDPETGKVIWTYPLTRAVRSGMTIPTPRKVGDQFFLTSFYNGSLMLRVGFRQAVAGLGEQEGERERYRRIAQRHGHAADRERIHLQPVQLRPVPLPESRHRRAPLGNVRADHRQVRALGQRVHREERRPQFSLQRKGRPHHRETQPGEIRGDQPRALARSRPIATRIGPSCGRIPPSRTNRSMRGTIRRSSVRRWRKMARDSMNGEERIPSGPPFIRQNQASERYQIIFLFPATAFFPMLLLRDRNEHRLRV